MGVDYKLFWSLNPHKLEPFYKAYRQKQKDLVTNMWMEGIYHKYAILSSLGDKVTYPIEPIGYNELLTREELQEKLELEMRRYIDSKNI